MPFAGNSATLWRDVSSKQGKREEQSLAWSNQLTELFKLLLSACSAAPKPDRWSLSYIISAECKSEALASLWECCSEIKLALQASVKAKGVLSIGSDPRTHRARTVRGCACFQWISRSQRAVPSSGSVPWAGWIPRCSVSGSSGQDGCWDHRTTPFSCGYWERRWDPPRPSSTSEFIWLQIWNSRKWIFRPQCHLSPRWAFCCL